MKTPGLDKVLDLIIVGAGPPALAGLYHAKQAGLSAIAIDKGPICAALVKHPTYMRWFSTADKLELCGFPLLVNEKNPTRREYLKYCRGFAKTFGLEVATYKTVTRIEKDGDVFSVSGHDLHGREFNWRALNVAVGTGFYDNPRPLNIPGENLPHVSHLYSESHFYAGYEVVIIGGGSSAAEVALELWREDANVTVVMRSDRFHTKYWVEPDIENRIKEGSITCYRNAQAKEIRPDNVLITDADGAPIALPCDFVLAMTGFEPDTSLLEAVGAEVNATTKKPTLSKHYETTVPGLYVIGTLCAGVDSNVVFIENSRDHGPTVVKHILSKPRVPEESRL